MRLFDLISIAADASEPTVAFVPPSDDQHPLVGTMLSGRYRIDAELGNGGMGAVFKAHQASVGRDVAIKVLRKHLTDKPGIVKRFKNEAKVIAALTHPNIVSLYDFGQTADGSMYLVMEFIEGRTLTDVLKNDAPVDMDTFYRLVTQMLDALIEAHEKGVVHRDLKPDNILITQQGRKKDVVKILDFGIAKVGESFGEGQVSADDIEQTSAGVIVGSPRYISPEQARSLPVGPETDLYALGLLMYELLSGKPAFSGETATDLLVAHVHHTPKPPSGPNGPMEGPLVDLIMKCLRKERNQRPRNAEEVLKAMLACKQAPLSSSPSELGTVMLSPPAVTTEVHNEKSKPKTSTITMDAKPHAKTSVWLWLLLLASAVFCGVAIWMLQRHSGAASEKDRPVIESPPGSTVPDKVPSEDG